MRKRIELGLLGAFLLCLPAAAQAMPVAPGYIVSEIVTPGSATGDVVAAGGALFVGIGSFGAGAQSIVRIDGGGTTTIAEGFNSLGGFAYDAVNDRLVVADNGLEAPGGAVTGDTVYAIDNPFATPGVAPLASTLELAPSGTVPGAAGVLIDPNDPDRIFVTDSFDMDLKAVDAVLGTASVLQSGLGFAAGLAEVGGTLYIGDLDSTFFTGTIWTVPVTSPGDPRSTFLSGLLGQFDLVLASDGSLLATASAFLVDSQILRIDPITGDTSIVASNFGFATGLDEEGGTIYVLDGGSLFALTVPEPSPLALGLVLAVGIVGLGRARR